MEKKLCREEGFVIGREIKAATSEFKTNDGSVIPAQPERFLLNILTSSLVKGDDGMQYITKHSNVKVEKAFYDKAKYLTKVFVTFEFSDKGNKVLDVELVKTNMQ